MEFEFFKGIVTGECDVSLHYPQVAHLLFFILNVWKQWFVWTHTLNWEAGMVVEFKLPWFDNAQ